MPTDFQRFHQLLIGWGVQSETYDFDTSSAFLEELWYKFAFAVNVAEIILKDSINIRQLFYFY